MGGYGSGWAFARTRRQSTEALQAIDVRVWARDGLIPGPSDLGWRGRGGRAADAGFEAEVEGRQAVHITWWLRGGGEDGRVTQRVPLDWTPVYFGGERVWFRCEADRNGAACGERAAKLYFVRGRFVCRECGGLTYESRRTRDRVDRVMPRIRAIRARLRGSQSLLDPFPERPKGMHRRTYERLRKEGLMLEAYAVAREMRRMGIRV